MDIDMDLFHATPAENVASILADGLRPQSPTWPIHLSTERGFEDLVAMCHDADDVVTLRVDAAGLMVSPGMDGPTSICSYRAIAASRITVAG